MFVLRAAVLDPWPHHFRHRSVGIDLRPADIYLGAANICVRADTIGDRPVDFVLRPGEVIARPTGIFGWSVAPIARFEDFGERSHHFDRRSVMFVLWADMFGLWADMIILWPDMFVLWAAGKWRWSIQIFRRAAAVERTAASKKLPVA